MKVASTAEIASRTTTRPTWAEVSLTTLRQNFRTVEKQVGTTVTVCAVVKADAYGHGAVECSRALEAEGVDIVFGYPGDPESLPDQRLRERELAPRNRKPLSEFVMSGSWGHPASFLGS